MQIKETGTRNLASTHPQLKKAAPEIEPQMLRLQVDVRLLKRNVPTRFADAQKQWYSAKSAFPACNVAELYYQRELHGIIVHVLLKREEVLGNLVIAIIAQRHNLSEPQITRLIFDSET